MTDMAAYDPQREQALEQALADAGAAYEADPSQEALQAHDAAAVALENYRNSFRTVGGIGITAEVNAPPAELEAPPVDAAVVQDPAGG